MRWLRDILRQQGYEDERVEIIDGGTDAETRELIRARFNEDPSQDSCADPAGHRRRRRGHRPPASLPPTDQLRHPVQPNRLEQRIGRVDRYGQTKAPDIRHFAPVADADSALSKDVDLLARVAVKIDQIMRDLGSANEIIAPDLQRQLGGEVIQSRGARRPRRTRSPG